MSEFEEKLNSILSSPEEMQKITQLAQSFAGGLSASPAGGAETPASMPAPVLSSLGGLLPDGMDMGSVARMMGMFGSAANSRSYQMLEAIRPHLKEKRQAKIDRAMQMARMAKMAQAAFKLQGSGKKES